ncbi:hypothetical protein [uncultured Bacteroides sp.]|uniref:hypothetical protein n=1 Tax=uncultured Bacteroides sp. TaxID=162156 RepID=UPI0025E66D38|nr:hypothetical protein [uncultured Bacteroides sp.]
MKKNKIVVLAGMALLTVGTILNVHDALNEFGVMEISLHPQVMAQSGSTAVISKDYGEQLEAMIYCKRETTNSSASSSSTGTKTNINGNTNTSGNTNTNSGTSGGATGNDNSWGPNPPTNMPQPVEEQYAAIKYYCGRMDYPNVCYVTDPCSTRLSTE